MAVTIYASGSQTCVDTTEHTLSAASETEAGVFQVFLDLNDMTDGETLTIRLKEKAQSSGGTQRVFWYDIQSNAQGEEKIWVSPAFMLINGWALSIQADGSPGTPVIPWSIRKG
jgi:hypothetical protein